MSMPKQEINQCIIKLSWELTWCSSGFNQFSYVLCHFAMHFGRTREHSREDNQVGAEIFHPLFCCYHLADKHAHHTFWVKRFNFDSVHKL